MKTRHVGVTVSSFLNSTSRMMLHVIKEGHSNTRFFKNKVQSYDNNNAENKIDFKDTIKNSSLPHAFSKMSVWNNASGMNAGDGMIQIQSLLQKFSSEDSKFIATLYAKVQNNEFPLQKFMQRLKDFVNANINQYSPVVSSSDCYGILINTIA